MAVFNVKEFLRLRSESVTVEGIEFELMSLTGDLINDLKSCESHNEMLNFAADYGLSVDGKRVVEDDYMSSRLDLLWANEALALEVDPCVKYRVGEKVCEISGLADFLLETLDAEELANVIEGDDLPDGAITLGQLNDDAIAAANVD